MNSDLQETTKSIIADVTRDLPVTSKEHYTSKDTLDVYYRDTKAVFKCSLFSKEVLSKLPIGSHLVLKGSGDLDKYPDGVMLDRLVISTNLPFSIEYVIHKLQEDKLLFTNTLDDNYSTNVSVLYDNKQYTVELPEGNFTLHGARMIILKKNKRIEMDIEEHNKEVNNACKAWVGGTVLLLSIGLVSNLIESPDVKQETIPKLEFNGISVINKLVEGKVFYTDCETPFRSASITVFINNKKQTFILPTGCTMVGSSLTITEKD